MSKWECVSGEGFIVNQAVHGLSALDVIYSALGVWALADASLGTKLSDPPVMVVGSSTNYFLAAQDQMVTITGHGLTVDEVYFLSTTVPGLLTATEPSLVAGYSNPIIKVLSANILSILPYRPSEIDIPLWILTGNILSPYVVTNTLEVGDGNATNPAYSFLNNADTGVYRDDATYGADSWIVSCGGAPYLACAPNDASGESLLSVQSDVGNPIYVVTDRIDAHGSGVYAGGLSSKGFTSTSVSVEYSAIHTYVTDWTNGSHESDLRFAIADGAGAAAAVTLMTLAPTELRVSTGDLVLEDTTNVVESEFKVAANNDVDTGTETVDSFDPDEDGACFWHYFVKKAGNLRSGFVQSVWDDSAGTAEYTEASTMDIGDTTDLTFTVDMSGALGTVRLRATTLSDDWIVKVVRLRWEGVI